MSPLSKRKPNWAGICRRYTTRPPASTIRASVDRMKSIEKSREDGTFDMLTKKEALEQERSLARLSKVLSGVRNMERLPSLLYVVDAKNELIAVKEARKLGIPIVGICDTNTDIELLDYPIPANDDAIKSIKLITDTIASAVADGRSGGQLLERIDEESRAAEEEVIEEKGLEDEAVEEKESEETEELEEDF